MTWKKTITETRKQGWHLFLPQGFEAFLLPHMILHPTCTTTQLASKHEKCTYTKQKSCPFLTLKPLGMPAELKW